MHKRVAVRMLGWLRVPLVEKRRDKLWRASEPLTPLCPESNL